MSKPEIDSWIWISGCEDDVGKNICHLICLPEARERVLSQPPSQSFTWIWKVPGSTGNYGRKMLSLLEEEESKVLISFPLPLVKWNLPPPRLTAINKNTQRSGDLVKI